MKIDWAYLRKGWTSCKNAQEFLENKKISTTETVDARKERINAENAWKILKSAQRITVAKGKKIQHFEQVVQEKETILKQVMGPSGNLRAPTVMNTLSVSMLTFTPIGWSNH